MRSEVDPARQAAIWLSRLVEAIGSVQRATTGDEAMRILSEAARSAAPEDQPASIGEQALRTEFARISEWALENVLLRERLVEQDQRLHLALEAASLGTWEHVPSTHSTYWDARSKAIFGLSPEEELDFERYRTAIHPDDAAGVFAGIAKSVDPAGSGECTLRYRIRDANGTERWVEAHGRCTFMGGVPQRINGTLLDITEQKRAEDAMREATRRKDEFLAVLGHELRNPLAPILTALEMMRLSARGQFTRERDVIERQVRHMMRLVDDLLDLARIARGSITLRREPTELRSAVARGVEMSSPLFEERRHRLQIDVPAGIWADVDQVRFAQVVSNLLTNAAKFTPRGGAVRVAARVESGEVLLEVEDTGIGIEPGDLASLFKPFVQLARRDDPAYSGLGLGLSLVRDLMQLHGGTVEAASEGTGRGSRFTIRLPAVAPQAGAPAQSALPRAGATQRRRVLLVDDNQDSAEMLGMLVEQLGHVAHVAFDGPGALAVAAEFAPDIAVLDIGLPVMDGYELAAQLREQLAARCPRLVALSGYGQETDKARSLEAGFFLHLTKPIDARELEAVLSD
jgi:PAS domain S-box-containing protein